MSANFLYIHDFHMSYFHFECNWFSSLNKLHAILFSLEVNRTIKIWFFFFASIIRFISMPYVNELETLAYDKSDTRVVNILIDENDDFMMIL